MSEPKGPTFHTSDTGIFVRENRPPRPGVVSFKYEEQDSHDTYEALRVLLKTSGFSFHRNPETVKHYRCIAHLHHHGQRGSLEFQSEIFPVGFEIKFYQNLVHENRSGGQYDFDKRAKMPYLIGLRFEWIKRRIVDILTERGYTCADKPAPKSALEAVMRERDELEAFQGKGFYERPMPDYNGRDQDGRMLEDGAVRYFRTFNGHLLRGTVYHHINNMWWVVVNRDEHHNIANFELFTYDPAKHPRKAYPGDSRKRLNAALGQAVKAENFERAAAIKAARGRMVREQAAQTALRGAA